MSDQGDFELFTGPAPSEKKEMNDEKFQEEMAQTQQAIKQLQQEEGKAKAYDNNLAAIIVQFLNQPGNTDLFLLISRAVAQNVSSELIIAILSLIDKKAQEEVKGLLKEAKGHEKTAHSALAIHEKADFKSLSPEQKKTIDKWVANIHHVAIKKPHRILEGLIIPGAHRELSPTIVQLSSFILRNYLAQHQVNIEFQSLHDFMQEVFVEIVKNLETLIREQKKMS